MKRSTTASTGRLSSGVSGFVGPLPAQQAAEYVLEAVHEVREGELGRLLDPQMQVIVLAVHFDALRLEVGTDFVEDGVRSRSMASCSNTQRQYSAIKTKCICILKRQCIPRLMPLSSSIDQKYNRVHAAPPSLQMRTDAKRRTAAPDGPLRGVVPVRLQQGAGAAEGTLRARRKEAWLRWAVQGTHVLAKNTVQLHTLFALSSLVDGAAPNDRTRRIFASAICQIGATTQSRELWDNRRSRLSILDTIHDHLILGIK